jgi:predicted amidohydrolase YtcJ
MPWTDLRLPVAEHVVDPYGQVRDRAEENAEAVEASNVIIGFGYDNAQLAEVRHPTKEDLDQVSEDIPVLIVHQSGRSCARTSRPRAGSGIVA